ncbi:P1 family peptidase [Comamonas sp. B21-038]|uniref:P1 family peptidase n=2 Tax=unclassified Comamonas TaxID=2638500 RepID=UPI001EFB3110|nr:P1 family peptidase [Comamonas sp. B21-038]ULR87998.1 P1 family peptidase [Comamonas sp. B21-038]
MTEPQDAALLDACRQLPVVGLLPAGPRNAITDVAGLRLGHCTLADGDLQTGVTVLIPPQDNPFMHKLPAGLAVINGFGKSAGLVQLAELGQIETPIALTNTFGVSAVVQAQIAQCIAANPECGRSLPTVNALVLECNDGYLSDIQRMAMGPAHYQAALDSASPDVVQGAVGAGRGMSAFQLKGGIGSASRQVVVGEQRYTVGALVLANMGKLADLRWGGQAPGAALERRLQAKLAAGAVAGAAVGDGVDKGSIIMLLATDAPLDSRQLSRLARRAAAGLANTGSCYGHGSGDIALAFSTAYTLPADAATPMPALAMLHEAQLDPLFRAAADAVEQSILNALWHAQSVQGRGGHQRWGLQELCKD